MNVNITLLGEMITFAILVWVTMKYIWPPITKAMNERQKKIADGLEAAERGKRSLELAREKIRKQLQSAKIDAADTIEQANKRVSQMLEAAKKDAGEETRKILELAKSDIATQMKTAKHELRKQIAELVINSSRKVLQETVDVAADKQLIDKFIEEIEYGR